MIDKIKRMTRRYQCRKLMKEAVDILTNNTVNSEKMTVTQLSKGIDHYDFLVKDNEDDTLSVRIIIYITDSGSGIAIKSIYSHNYDFDIERYIDEYTNPTTTIALATYKKNRYVALMDILELLLDNTELEWIRYMIALDRKVELEGLKNDKPAEEVQNV